MAVEPWIAQESTIANPRLISIGPPLVGATFIFEPVDFEPEDILHWQWSLESIKKGDSTWLSIPGKKFSILVLNEYRHKRLKAVVTLRGNRKLSGISFPVLTPEEYSREISLEKLSTYSEVLSRKIVEFRSVLDRLVNERRKYKEEQQIASKLQRLEEVQQQVTKEKLKLEQQKKSLEMRELKIQREAAALRKFADEQKKELDSKILEFAKERDALLADHDLQAKLGEVVALARDVEDAWDVLDKANHLRVKLSPQSRNQILQIVQEETKIAREKRSLELAGAQPQSTRCAIHGGGQVTGAFTWGSICADCSK